MSLAFGDPVHKIERWLAECERDGIHPKDPRRKTPNGDLELPKFVQFHMFDPGSCCDEIFWKDPLTFTPCRGRNGYIDSWGIYPHDERGYRQVDGRRVFERTSITQLVYREIPSPTPEIQFINALIDRKVSQLKQLDLGDLSLRDYTLYISLPFIDNPHDNRSDRYWRRVRLSGGMPLNVFADKIITPIWGWVRNLHAHLFHDFKDGAMFGPKDCTSMDMMHLDKSGYAYIPEEEYCIAHVLRQVGEVMGYHYDLGDNWWVDVKLEEIMPKDESTGAVVVLDGAGGTLPDGEDIGTFNWAGYLSQAARSRAGKRKAVTALFGATNHTAKLPPMDPIAYDFDAFDLEETRRVVKDALDSKASLSYASKRFVSSVGGTQEDLESLMSDLSVKSRIGKSPREMKRGTAIMQTPIAGASRTFLEEGVNLTRRDNPMSTLCANCGTPHNLKACARCGQRYYCGKECQRSHWKEKHKSVCGKSGSARST